MKRGVLLAALAVAALAGCGSEKAPQTAPARSVPASPVPARASACREPSGQEKGALRFAVRGHDPSSDAGPPWARVRRGDVNYLAAVLDVQDAPSLAVLVSYPQSGRFLAGMRAVNGTARTFTDLPKAGGGGVPEAGAEALACVG